MTSELKKQYTLRISQANKTELIVILYEMFLTYIQEGDEAKERAEFREAVRKARGCINELMNSLNFEYELAESLLRLYVYVNKELACADVRDSKEPLEHCRKVITGLLEAYREISSLDNSSPVMENAQTVYAGLTYGKNELTENLTNQGENRGFFV